ncbi:MAG: ABC transporter permease, partial [Verrucomicrobiia bacterium]
MGLKLREAAVKINLSRNGLIIILIILCVALSLATDNFLTIQNLLIVAKQISINGILAVGVTYVLLSGGVDLSLGSVVALTGVVSALFAKGESFPLMAPLVVGIFAGTACGFLNGIIIGKGRVAPFIATLGMMTVARGLALVISGGKPVTGLNSEFMFFGAGDVFGLPIPVVILAATAGLSAVILKYTPIGRHIYAVGGSELAARVCGINVFWVKLFAYTICGAFAGLAGVVLASRITAGQPNAGIAYELDAIAAVVIGGTSLSGGV